MAYDAGMLRCVVNEINALGACKVEKIYQPMNDEIVLMLHAGRESLRLLINAGSFNLKNNKISYIIYNIIY
ncbi:MAG: NFACT family protein [Clostridia bacterium]|nr:NFACT family protein [Clostridia bacterium]